MKELKCKNCGAPLLQTSDNYKCEYCGSIYKIEDKINTPYLTVIQSPHAEVLSCETILDRWATENYPSEYISKYTLQQLSAKLAEGLAGYLKLTTTKDYINDAIIVRGTIRVIPPDYRF